MVNMKLLMIFAVAACALAADRDEWVWGDNNRRASRVIDGPGVLSLNGGSYGLGGNKVGGVYNNRQPGGYNDRYADGPINGGFGRPQFDGPGNGGFGRPPFDGPGNGGFGGPQGFAAQPPPFGGPGAGGFPPGPPPSGPGVHGGRPPLPPGGPGRVPPYEDPFLKEPGLHTGGYDTCKCTLSFNCNSPGIKFGVCDEGKQYCCYNSHIAGSNRRPNNIGGPGPLPAVLAGPGGPRDFPPGAPPPPPQHRPGGPGGPFPGAGQGRPPFPEVLTGPGGPYDVPPRPHFGGGPVPYSARKTKDL